LQDNLGTYKHSQEKKSQLRVMDPSLVVTILLPFGKSIIHGNMACKLCKSFKFPVI